jgi:hypothetical protein
VKKVPLRVINEKLEDGKEFVFDYGEVILKALNAGGLQGVTVEAMRNRIKVIDKVEQARKEEQDYILLEEVEHTTLLEQVKVFPFARVFRSAVQLLDEIEHAADVEVAEVKDADSEA